MRNGERLSPMARVKENIVSDSLSVNARVNLTVVFRCPLERFPVDRIMAMNDQGYVLAAGYLDEFARAGAEACFIHVKRPQGALLRIKISRTGNRINGQQDRAGLRETHEHRLVTRTVTARLNQVKTRQELHIPIDQTIAQRRMIPVLPVHQKAIVGAC